MLLLLLMMMMVMMMMMMMMIMIMMWLLYFVAKVHGPQAAAVMRAMGYMGPIIAVTGNAMQKDVDEFLKMGADAVVKKPFKNKEIQELLVRFKLL